MVETAPVAPGPDYTWTPGYWSWSGGTWVWVRGIWVVRPHVGAIWVGGHWVRHGHGTFGCQDTGDKNNFEFLIFNS